VCIHFQFVFRARARDGEELHCVKQELDKVKQDASRFWKAKEHYLRELRSNNVDELKGQIGAEQAKVLELRRQIEAEQGKALELTKEKKDILKSREQLLTRLV
jgi:septal ring factor EnvC (AmiA/AmiB activator)